MLIELRISVRLGTRGLLLLPSAVSLTCCPMSTHLSRFPPKVHTDTCLLCSPGSGATRSPGSLLILDTPTSRLHRSLLWFPLLGPTLNRASLFFASWPTSHTRPFARRLGVRVTHPWFSNTSSSSSGRGWDLPGYWLILFRACHRLN